MHVDLDSNLTPKQRICFFNLSKHVAQTYKFNHLTIPSHFHLLLSFLFHSLILLDQNSMASENSFRNTMESSQWNKLPRYLEILVLERLPLLDLRRLSFTCKYFHSLLSDPSFAIHYDEKRVDHRFAQQITMGFSSPLFGRNEGLSSGKARLGPTICGDPSGAPRLTAMDSYVLRHLVMRELRCLFILCSSCITLCFPTSAER